MIRVLCYGDSNTWGYVSGTDYERYDENKRYPKILQRLLGNGYEILEEGLCSRTLKHDDLRPNREGRNGFTTLKPCLDGSGDIDFFILMLGTNDLKKQYDLSPNQILSDFKDYISFLAEYYANKKAPTLIVSGIPPVNDETDFCKQENKFVGGRVKAIGYQKILKNYCVANSIRYIDNSDLSVGVDGVHLTENSQKLLAEKLADLIKKL